MDELLVVGIRWSLYLTLSIAFGVPLFALHAVTPDCRTMLPLRPLIGLSVAAAMVLSLLGWVALTAQMADKPLAGVTHDDLMAMLATPGLGVSWLLRIAALGVLMLAAAIAGFERTLPILGTVLGAVALGSLAWSGHGAAGDNGIGQFHLAADVIHLLAAGAWIGALAALSLLLSQAIRDAAVAEAAHASLASFGRTGTIIVAVIVGTGLVNSWVLAGPDRLLELPMTLWGQLLLIKLALFAAMLGLAAINRWALTPALSSTATATILAITRLRQTVALETGAALLVLAAVAWLGTLAPLAAS